MHALAAGGVGRYHLQPALRIADLTDCGGCRIFIEQGAKAFEEAEVLGPALVVEMVLVVVGVDRGCGLIVAFFRRQRRIVFQALAMEVEIDRVEPEAVDAALQPEAGNASWTWRLWKLRSGCSARKLCR